jgi:hypothetical protein
MKKLLILLTLAALAHGLFADDLDGYETVLSVGFEEEEGYVLGSLTGQQGWTAFSENFPYREVVNNVYYGGNQSLYIFTTEGHNSGNQLAVSYDNPYEDYVYYSFAFRPSHSPVRFQIMDREDRRIKKFSISTKELTLDNPFRSCKFNDELSTDAWYQVCVTIDPSNNLIPNFNIGEELETETEYDNSSDAAGDIGSIVVMTEWTDTETHAYLDDIEIQARTTPEPSMLVLLLFSLCLIRKQI